MIVGITEILSVILIAREDRFELNEFQNETFHKLFVSIFDYICRTSITGNYGAAFECWISKENFSENASIYSVTRRLYGTRVFLNMYYLFGFAKYTLVFVYPI